MTDYVGALLGNGYSSFGSYAGYSGYSGYTSGVTGGYRDLGVSSASQSDTISRNFASKNESKIKRMNIEFEKGNIKKGLKLYNELLKALETKYGELDYDDSELTDILNDAYKDVTKEDIIYEVEENTNCPFVTGLAEGIPVIGLFVNGKSDQEVAAKVTGGKATFGDKMAEWGGAMVTGISGGAAAGAGVGVFFGGIGAVPGAVVGGIVGAVTGTLKCIFK